MSFRNGDRISLTTEAHITATRTECLITARREIVLFQKQLVSRAASRATFATFAITLVTLMQRRSDDRRELRNPKNGQRGNRTDRDQQQQRRKGAMNA